MSSARIVSPASAYRKLDVLPFGFRDQALHVFELRNVAAFAGMANLASTHSDAVRHSFVMEERSDIY